MRKTTIKIDRFILDQLTAYVRKWIQKKEFKKHKIDFEIECQKVKLCLLFLLAMLIPAMTFLFEGRYFQAGFQASIWSISVAMAYYRLQQILHKTKPEHDLAFSQRKNTAVYEMEKQVLEFVFIKMRKQRVYFIVLDFVVSWFFSIGMFLLCFLFSDLQALLSLVLYFFIEPFLGILEQYIFFVFDFDPPEPKKKVRRASLTEIVLREWQALIGGLSPHPVPN